MSVYIEYYTNLHMKVQRPTFIRHRGSRYYSANDIKKYDPEYFYGTSVGIRKIIKKKNINSTVFHYATFSNKSGWKSCNQEKPCKKAVLLLLKSWVIKNIPSMMSEHMDLPCENDLTTNMDIRLYLYDPCDELFHLLPCLDPHPCQRVSH